MRRLQGGQSLVCCFECSDKVTLRAHVNFDWISRILLVMSELKEFLASAERTKEQLFLTSVFKVDGRVFET